VQGWPGVGAFALCTTHNVACLHVLVECKRSRASGAFEQMAVSPQHEDAAVRVPELLGDRFDSDGLPCPCSIRLRQPRRGRLVSARIHGDGGRVRTLRGHVLRALQLVRVERGRLRVMIVARTSTGRAVVHTPLADVRALSTCHRRRLYLVSERNETEGGAMKVFVAGATGVLGRELVPQLVARGHEVVGMTRSASKQDLVRSLGARPVVADALDPDGAPAHDVAQAGARADRARGERHSLLGRDHPSGRGSRAVGSSTAPSPVFRGRSAVGARSNGRA
jgi:hypothetical protein